MIFISSKILVLKNKSIVYLQVPNKSSKIESYEKAIICNAFNFVYLRSQKPNLNFS